MAIRARVELRGCLTHQGVGRIFKKGSPQILTNPAEIRYYQSQAGFSVTVLENKAKSVVQEPIEEQPDDTDGDNDFTESELRKMKKAELIDIADELGLDSDGTVNELVDRILEAK